MRLQLSHLHRQNAMIYKAYTTTTTRTCRRTRQKLTVFLKTEYRFSLYFEIAKLTILMFSLSEITSRLDGALTVATADDGYRCTIASTSGSYSLSCDAADDFPDLPTLDATTGASMA